MKEEIKEILDILKTNMIHIRLFKEDREKLLDYITNLQEKNERLNNENKQYKEYIKELKDSLRNYHIKNNKLINENERLKQPQIFIDTMDMEERYGQELYEDYLKEQLEDYKQRNEKALDKLYCYGEIFDSKILQEFQKEMENILKGDKE